MSIQLGVITKLFLGILRKLQLDLSLDDVCCCIVSGGFISIKQPEKPWKALQILHVYRSQFPFGQYTVSLTSYFALLKQMQKVRTGIAQVNLGSSQFHKFNTY